MRDFKIYLTVACLLLVLYIVVKYNKPQPVNWKPTLSYQDKIPFGTYVFYNRLADIFPGAQVSRTNASIYKLFSRPMQAGNYIIISKAANLSKDDFNKLVNFIKAGNNVLISAFAWSQLFERKLKITTGIEDNVENTALNFVDPSLKGAKYYKFDNNISNTYFSKFDTTAATVISKNHAGKATFLSYAYGKGKLLVCADPLLFSNFSVLTPQGAEYAERALSYLPVAKKVYWDMHQNQDVESDESPVRVFLNNPGLQWAYYLSLFTLTIYILFQVKRSQRPIPVIEPLKNSTLDFVNVVGRVYFEKRDNTDIAYKKILYLLSYLRERYQLKTSNLDAEFIDILVHKTSISLDDATELVDQINYIKQNNNITDNELIILNQLIEKFYSQS
jgi:hypothetical protein